MLQRAAISLVIITTWTALPGPAQEPAKSADPLVAGFAEVDITPELGKNPVYLAGFGQNRKATAISDRLMARAVVLRHGEDKLALVSVDLVGLFHEAVERVRQRLPGFKYVLVSSTHNHEGPDTVGIWGKSPFHSGVDPAYMRRLEARIVKAVKNADAAADPAHAHLGTAHAPELLHDGRLPHVKHDELVAILFKNAKTDKNVGAVVQWNCHPETLSSNNTRISADFVGYTVRHLQNRLGCPVVFFTGTVGGLMTSLHVDVRDREGNKLVDGTFRKTQRYGELVGQLAQKAIAQAKRVSLTPFHVAARRVFLPLDNRLYWVGWQLGVLKRKAFFWKDDPYRARPVTRKTAGKARLCIRTEIAWLRLGELDVAAIPGEIYPELVLGRVQEPADPGADFPDARVEPAVYKQLKGPHRMLIGLANDEVGYILPKRQWDVKAPFCYGRKKAQYGEANSVGPETGPILCRAFQQLVRSKKTPKK